MLVPATAAHPSPPMQPLACDSFKPSSQTGGIPSLTSHMISHNSKHVTHSKLKGCTKRHTDASPLFKYTPSRCNAALNTCAAVRNVRWNKAQPAESKYCKWSQHRMPQHLPGCAAAYCTPSAADAPRFSAQACESLLLVRPPQQCPANQLTCFALSLTMPTTGILVRQGNNLRSDQMHTTDM